MSLHAQLQRRQADGKPIRIGLIGAGKFGSMYLAQIPRTPGIHLVGIADLSPWDRVSVYLSLCAVSNHIRRFKRPEYIAHRDFTPIDCLPDDCLLKNYPVELPWKAGMPASALETSIDELKIAA